MAKSQSAGSRRAVRQPRSVPSDLELFLAHIRTHAHRRESLIIRLLAETGINPSELVTLRGEDHDAHAQTLRVAKAARSGEARTLSLSASLSSDLASFIADEGTARGECLFRTRQSDAITTRRIEQILANESAEAGFAQAITPRALRTAFLAQAAKESTDDAELKERTGLASITKRQVLSAQEEKSVRRAAKGFTLREQSLFALLLETGLGIGEALTLPASALDEKNAIITLPDRAITITAGLARLLSRIRTQRTHASREGLLFAGRQGGFSTRRAEQVLAAIGTQAGIRLTPRLLRATAIARKATTQGEDQAMRDVGLATPLRYTHGIISARMPTTALRMRGPEEQKKSEKRRGGGAP